MHYLHVDFVDYNAIKRKKTISMVHNHRETKE